MKRTVILIIILIIVASGLLFYALSINFKPQMPKSQLTPSVSPSLTPVADTSLFITPEYVTLSSNSASFEINVDTGSNEITGVQLEIAYDPKIIKNMEIQPGDIFRTPTILLNQNDEKTGRISYALVLSPSQQPVTGTGIVATLILNTYPESDTVVQTNITILPKSLVSAIGVDGSVLRDIKNATINFSPSSRSFPVSTIAPTSNIQY